jgi:hypothetical protein
VPDLTKSAGDEAWAQPFCIASEAARGLRKSLTDPYVQRQFKPLAFTQEEFEVAMNVFGDHLCEERGYRSAEAEFIALTDIETSDASNLDKCRRMVGLMRGDPKAESGHRSTARSIRKANTGSTPNT